MEKVKNEQRERKFKTLFDGDEYDGKRYALHRGVTGLDAATSNYLVNAGRIIEVSEAEYNDLERADAGDEGEDENLGQFDADTSLETARADFDAGRIPDDLIDASKPVDAEDRLIAKSALQTMATDAGVEYKPADTKPELAIAIMAKRAAAGE